MRDYGRVHSAIWSSPDFLSFSDDAKIIALYLLTSPHTTMTGAFRLPNGYVCADLGWELERVKEGLQELFRKGFCNRCETTKWVWICKFLRWNPPENPNQWKAVQKQAAQIPKQCAWVADFIKVLRESFAESRPDDPNPFETVSKPGAGTGTGAGTGGKHPGPSGDGPPDETDDDFERLWSKRPRRAGNDPKHGARKALNARLREKCDIRAIEEGLERYHRFCHATGKIETEKVMQFQTFLGPSKPWEQAWTLPRRSNSLSDANQAAIERAMEGYQ